MSGVIWVRGLARACVDPGVAAPHFSNALQGGGGCSDTLLFVNGETLQTTPLLISYQPKGANTDAVRARKGWLWRGRRFYLCREPATWWALTAWFFSLSLVVFCFSSALWEEQKQEVVPPCICAGDNAVGWVWGENAEARVLQGS